MLYAVVMAGGSGKRFWPRSRMRLPKQLIRITGPKTMIQEEIERLRLRFPPERILIITNAQQVAETQRQLPEFPGAQIIGEPVGRDTAACIGLGAALLARQDPEAIMATMPADHVITPPERFHQTLEAAAEIAARDRVMLTFGIRPTEPSTQFGYIERGERIKAASGAPDLPIFRLARFTEKPDRPTAEKMIGAGCYYWNSGIFVWRVTDILAAIKESLPQLHAGIMRIANAAGGPRFAEVMAQEYPRLPKISIDYGVMEKARNVAVIAADYAWDDVGAWMSLERLRPADAAGNIILAEHFGRDTSSCVIAGEEKHLIATIGVKDLIIVQTPDATLICDRSRGGEVKGLVDELARRGYHQFL